MIFARRRYSVSSCRVSVRITRAGFPTATESAGMSRVTTAPAPMTGTVADGDARADDHPSAQPAVVADGDRTARFESSAALCRASNGCRAVSSCTLGPMSVWRPMRIGARSRNTQSKLTNDPSPM